MNRTQMIERALSLYLVTDADLCRSAGRTVADTVKFAVSGGVSCVQVRHKSGSDAEFLLHVAQVADALPPEVPLIVNDRVDLFLAARSQGVRVSGVHIGATDGDPVAVRDAIGADAILGLSARTAAEILRWNDSNAHVDYFGIGPVFTTATKPDAPAGMGVPALGELVALSSIPCVAIGGIDAGNIGAVLNAGVSGCAVVSAICAAPSPRDAARGLAQRKASCSAQDPVAPSLPVVLTIAGTDPTAGAGLQGDNKTIGALECYAVSVVTAVVAQNTSGVSAFECVNPTLIRSQLDAVWSDTTVDAIKIGMLGTTEIIETVAQWIDDVTPQRNIPIVIDPVMVATSGDSLFAAGALDALKALISKCSIVTPNASELAVLAGTTQAHTFDELLRQAHQVAEALGVHVIAKGGHLQGGIVRDALIDPHAESAPLETVHHNRVPTHRTHGTGCALSSAIAAKLAHQPNGYGKAFVEARAWLQRAIEGADQLAFGRGNGPIHHLAHPTDEAILAPIRALSDGRDPRSTLTGWWEASKRVRTETDNLDFVKELARGTLPIDHFLHYLEQDALYLREYSRALAVAADLAPTLVEQRFWMQGAHMSLVVERALHDSWLTTHGLDLESPHPTPVTRDYTNHFLSFAREGSYELLVASLLPCYWMYQDIGDRLNRAHNHPNHPYREWLTAYSEPRFEQSTLAARTIVAHHVDRALTRGNERLVGQMCAAFLASCEYERDFFAGPSAYLSVVGASASDLQAAERALARS